MKSTTQTPVEIELEVEELEEVIAPGRYVKHNENAGPRLGRG